MKNRNGFMAAAEKLGETIFSSSIRILETEYQKEEKRQTVRQVFAELMEAWGKQTQEEAAALGICYLHSSILMRSAEIRLTLYGRALYMDEKRLEKAWTLPRFFGQYEQDMTEIMDKLRKEFPRIYPYEEDAVRFWYAQYYYAALKVLCKDMLEEIRKGREYRMLNKTEDFYFFFGRWRGEAEKLACMENT